MFMPGWEMSFMLGSFWASGRSAAFGNWQMWMLPVFSSRKRTEFSGMARKTTLSR